MRRLALLALLLVCPAVAHADGLPGTSTYYFYPLTGCTMGGDVCVSANTQMIPDGRFWTSFTCTWAYGICTTGPVGTEGFLYNADGSLIYRCCPGLAQEVAPGSVPAFGVFEGTVNLGEGPDMQHINYGPLLVTTPEPGSMVLLGSGLIALAGVARRRRRTEA